MDTSSKQPNRLEYESGLENFFTSLTAFSGLLAAGAVGTLIVCLTFAMLGWLNGENTRGWTGSIPNVLLFLVGFLLVAIFFGWIRSGIDIYYFLDHKQKRLLLRRKVFFYSSETVVSQFRDLHCLAVAGRFVRELRGKGVPPREYWQTALWMVTKNGSKIRVSDYKAHGSWFPDEEELAKTLKLSLMRSPSADHALRVRRTPQGPEVTFGPQPWASPGCLLGIALCLATAVALYAAGVRLK